MPHLTQRGPPVHFGRAGSSSPSSPRSRVESVATDQNWRRAACKKQKAKLVIAKLDRLSRNLAFIATLMDSGVEFIAVDNPHANKLTIHILASWLQSPNTSAKS
jgi:hypothetical protein